MNVRVWTMGLLCAAGLSAEAADFDGSRLLICAPVEAKACAATEVCTNGTPGELGAPRFEFPALESLPVACELPRLWP